MGVLTEKDREKAIAAGEFLHSIPADQIHYGCRRATVTPRAFVLKGDFEVGLGPPLEVCSPHARRRLVDDATYSSAAGPAGCRFSRAGQRCSLPFDPELYNTLRIPASIRRDSLREYRLG